MRSQAGPTGDHRDQHAIDVSSVLIPVITRRARAFGAAAVLFHDLDYLEDPRDPRPVVNNPRTLLTSSDEDWDRAPQQHRETRDSAATRCSKSSPVPASNSSSPPLLTPHAIRAFAART